MLGTDLDAGRRRAHPQVLAGRPGQADTGPGIGGPFLDVAAASCSCRFPSLCSTRGYCDRYARVTCTVGCRGPFRSAGFPISACALSVTIFQPCCCMPCNTPAPPVVPFALILAGGRSLLLLGILRPARRAGQPPNQPAPGTRPAGRTQPRGPGSFYTVCRDLGGHGGPDVLTVT